MTSLGLRVSTMVLNTTFNYISVILWWLVLLVEETGVPGEIHGPVASHFIPILKVCDNNMTLI